MYDHRPLLERLLARESLSVEESRELFGAMMEGEIPPIPFAALLVALRAKGESVGELLGAAQAMRERCHRVKAPPFSVDLCGTGGDRQGTLNVSTAASLVVASLKVPVAKHGNRGVSSACGSADLVEALGLPVELSPEEAAEKLERQGFAFLFAPRYHPAMKHAVEPRKALGVRTIFNLLGPLSNPAFVRYQLLGVFSPHWLRPVAETLKALGTARALVVHGEEGLDEVSPERGTFVVELREGSLKEYTLTPGDFGAEPVPLEELKGSTPKENARRVEAALRGEEKRFARWIAMNAALALKAARDMPVQEGYAAAYTAMESGEAYRFLLSLRG